MAMIKELIFHQMASVFILSLYNRTSFEIILIFPEMIDEFVDNNEISLQKIRNQEFSERIKLDEKQKFLQTISAINDS